MLSQDNVTQALINFQPMIFNWEESGSPVCFVGVRHNEFEMGQPLHTLTFWAAISAHSLQITTKLHCVYIHLEEYWIVGRFGVVIGRVPIATYCYASLTSGLGSIYHNCILKSCWVVIFCCQAIIFRQLCSAIQWTPDLVVHERSRMIICNIWNTFCECSRSETQKVFI